MNEVFHLSYEHTGKTPLVYRLYTVSLSWPFSKRIDILHYDELLRFVQIMVDDQGGLQTSSRYPRADGSTSSALSWSLNPHFQSHLATQSKLHPSHHHQHNQFWSISPIQSQTTNTAVWQLIRCSMDLFQQLASHNSVPVHSELVMKESNKSSLPDLVSRLLL